MAIAERKKLPILWKVFLGGNLELHPLLLDFTREKVKGGFTHFELKGSPSRITKISLWIIANT